MDTKIRRAEETDAEFVAWVELAAARSQLQAGFLDIALGGEEAERLALVTRLCRTGARSMAHWSGFLVVEQAGRLVSGLSGYEPTAFGPDSFSEAMKEALGEAGWSAGDVDAALARMAPFRTCAPQTRDDVWVVEWVATRPEHRGQGLVLALLAKILDEGRRRGYRRAQIGVMIGNDPAQRAYERSGFKVVDEKRHRDFERTFGPPGIRRMLRDL